MIRWVGASIRWLLRRMWGAPGWSYRPGEAEDRAEALLVRHLSPAQRATWENAGYFLVEGKDARFKISRLRHRSVCRAQYIDNCLMLVGGAAGPYWYPVQTSLHHELFPKEMPAADVVLLQKLTIEATGRLPDCRRFGVRWNSRVSDWLVDKELL